MTSLQKAAAAASQSSRLSFLTSNGQLENCFASGLDLSEFDGAAAESGDEPLECAAAKLLLVKEEERRQREREENSDKRMQEVVRERVAGMQEILKKNRESNVLVNALVQMHGVDTRDPSVFRKNKKLAKKICNVKHHASFAPSSYRKAHKKSHRSKH